MLAEANLVISYFRGRDHGLPPYTVYRNLCGLPSLGSWASRPAEIRADAWSRLQTLYSTPNDIDLFTGGTKCDICYDY